MPTKLHRVAALCVLSALPLTGCTLTPSPLTDGELNTQGAVRLERFAQVRQPVTGTLTLSEVIARAVSHNLDHRVEMYETALRQAELGVSTAAMLPALTASAGSTVRDRPLASSSFNLVTNTPNFGFSTSQDERLRTADLAFSWNILDFGLSYVRARQSADKVLIALENRRRVVHKLVSDVRTAYWRAYAAQTMRDRLRRLESRSVAALATSRRQSVERATSPITAITYRRELLEVRRTLQELQRELSAATVQLAALINERPGATFTLAPPRMPAGLAVDAADVDHWIATAMAKRPELREVAYRRRINAHELHAALLELLPGLQLHTGRNLDSNSFLMHDHWINWGLKATWNVVRLIQYPARRDQIEAQDEALAQRDLALTLAVMTQIHVSRARIAVIQREQETARTYAATQRELIEHMRAELAAAKISEQTVLREEMNDAVAQLRRLLADANLQTAYADLLVAVGIDPPTYTEDLPSLEKISTAWTIRTLVHPASDRRE